MAIRNRSVLQQDTNDSPISEPHFDEEWTLLTARPVVPLNELRTTPVLRKVLKLVGAFAAAGLFGALVAVASIRLRGETTGATLQPIAQQDNVQENLDTPAETTGIVSTDANNSQVSLTIPETPVPVTKAPVKLTEATKRKTENPVLPQTTRTPESLETIAAEVLAGPRPADHWEEQRPRRVTNRRHSQQADRQVNRTRGVGRIDEIFEGTPQRPEN